MTTAAAAAKRGHVVPESQMAALREAATAAAAELFAAMIRAEREPATVAETPAAPAPLRLRGFAETPAAPAPVRVVDVTPTWRAILPLLRAGAEDGTPEGKRIAWEELARMADAADKWNASVSA